jgi:hypothetical protein
MFSIIHKLHGRAVLLLPSLIPGLHGHTVGSWASRFNSPNVHKYLSNSTRKFQAPTMLPPPLFFRALLVLLDPPWIIASSWKLFVARRILVLRVIVSPILVPWQARESSTVARRILVISLESSYHRYEAILVFARAQMCGHHPLVCSAYANKPVKQTSVFLIGLLVFYNAHRNFTSAQIPL